MKKNITGKLLTVIMATALIGSMLSGCGKTQEPEVTQPVEETVEEPAVEEEKPKEEPEKEP
ncbi:MAG: hypothetical protein IK078_11420, partial [Lachnospiraceae bacterium]|nr:hypothetical protein [Lachnospiraceae bacterium]